MEKISMLNDEIVDRIYNCGEAIDLEVKAKENVLRRFQAASHDLLEILTKSEPIDQKNLDSWGTGNFRVITPSNAFSCPIVNRNAWIHCPLRLIRQWTCVVKENVVIGVEVENNFEENAYVADISAAIVISSADDQQWCKFSRSYCFGNFDLVPKEINFLRPGDKAFLVATTLAPSNLLESDLIFVCQASVSKEHTGDKTLPFFDSKWSQCGVELCTIPGNTFNGGQKTLIIRKAIDLFERMEIHVDPTGYQQLIISLIANQRQKRFRMKSSSAKLLFENAKLQLENCWPSTDKVKYCRLPLFDGILIFTDSIDGQLELIISGWNYQQIDQFTNQLITVSPRAAHFGDKDEVATVSEPNTADMTEKLIRLADKGTDIVDDDDILVLVDGGEYRSVVCDVLGLGIVCHL